MQVDLESGCKLTPSWNDEPKPRAKPSKATRMQFDKTTSSSGCVNQNGFQRLSVASPFDWSVGSKPQKLFDEWHSLEQRKTCQAQLKKVDKEKVGLRWKQMQCNQHVYQSKQQSAMLWLEPVIPGVLTLPKMRQSDYKKCQSNAGNDIGRPMCTHSHPGPCNKTCKDRDQQQYWTRNASLS